MNVYEVTYKSKKSKKKEEEKALPLDQCTSLLSSITVQKEHVLEVTPSEFFSNSSKMQENKKRKIPKFDHDFITVKERYFRKSWYSLYGIQYATWSSSLQEYYIDYSLLWKNIVEPELFARGALLTWRTFPCKLIMTTLPKGFSSWNELFLQGGIKDEATNQGSFTEQQKKNFWNDQCSCPCWKPLFLQKAPSTSSSSTSCICLREACICDEIIVDNSWESKINRLSKIVKQCPWNRLAAAEIQIIQDKIVKKEEPFPSITYREYVLGKKESLMVQKEIIDEENYQDSCAQKCFDFFYNLENDFIQEKKHTPLKGEDLLEWFWKGKEEFLQIYRQKCPEERFKLLYLNGL